VFKKKIKIDGKTATVIGLIYKSVPHEFLDHELEFLAINLSQKQRPAIR